MMRLIVGYDFTSRANLALTQAAAICCRFDAAELHVITVLNRGLKKAGVIDDIDFRNAQKVQRRVSSIADQFARDGTCMPSKLYVHARIGKPDEEMLNLAAEISADLILLGNHAHTGIERLALGSVAESVVRDAHCPVLVSRPKTYDEQPAFDAPRPEPPDSGQPDDAEYLEPHVWHFVSDAPTRPDAWPIY